MPPSPNLGITAAVYLTPMAKTAHLTLGVAFRPKRRFENVQLYIGDDGEKIEHNQQNCPTGKSLLIFRNRVKPKNQKYFAFAVGQISGMNLPILSHQEGRSRSSRNAGQGAVDADAPLTNGA